MFHFLGQSTSVPFIPLVQPYPVRTGQCQTPGWMIIPGSQIALLFIAFSRLQFDLTSILVSTSIWDNFHLIENGIYTVASVNSIEKIYIRKRKRRRENNNNNSNNKNGYMFGSKDVCILKMTINFNGSMNDDDESFLIPCMRMCIRPRARWCLQCVGITIRVYVRPNKYVLKAKKGKGTLFWKGIDKCMINARSRN